MFKIIIDHDANNAEKSAIPDPNMHHKVITRTGVYGVVISEGKMLVIRQKYGPYAGKFDFPGGGIEFGESPEGALCREFDEEVRMEFDSIQLINNLTTTIEVPKTPSSEPYSFFQIGMIYLVNGCRLIEDKKLGELQPFWVNPEEQLQENCSLLLWQFIKAHLSHFIHRNK